MGGSGAAASTDHLHAEVFNEVHQLHLQLHRREAVMGHPANVFRQSGVGNAADGEGGMLREVANVLLHLLRTGGAVQAEDVDREWLKDRHHSGDIGADEHGARGFHRDGDHQGPPLTGGGKGRFDALECCLDLQHVLTGFDDEQVDVAGDQSLSLLAERIPHRVEIDVAKGGQLGGGPHGARHETWLLRGAEFISHFPGQLGCPLVQLKGLVFQAVFRQHNRCSAEGIGFDDIAAHLEELAMHCLDCIRFGDRQVLVATLQVRTTEIIRRKPKPLKAGASGTVEHEHRTLWPMQVLEECRGGGLPICLRHHHPCTLGEASILRKAQGELQAVDLGDRNTGHPVLIGGIPSFGDRHELGLQGIHHRTLGVQHR